VVPVPDDQDLGEPWPTETVGFLVAETKEILNSVRDRVHIAPGAKDRIRTPIQKGGLNLKKYKNADHRPFTELVEK